MTKPNFAKFKSKDLSEFDEWGPESKQEKEFEELELKLILDIFSETYHRKPTEKEIEQQKIEITKLKYLVDCWIDEYFELENMKERLIMAPKGFHLDEDGQPCSICNRAMKAEDSWFDKNGIKCMTCQKAVDNEVIPALVCKSRERWYSKDQMEAYFGLDDIMIKRMIKSGELKSRDIMTLDGKSLWFRLFLDQENLIFKWLSREKIAKRYGKKAKV